MFTGGGIVGAVALRAVPALYITDVFAIPDWKTGELRIQMTLRNAGVEVDAVSDLTVAAAPAEGKPLAQINRAVRAKTGENLVEAVMKVPDHRLWSPESPFLYRLTVAVHGADGKSVDQQSVRIGFRDFRFENGYFRLNGHRIVPKGLFYYNTEAFPITYVFPHDPALVRKDIEILKAAGCNFVRCFNRTCPALVELCDEAGILVCQEHLANWKLEGDPSSFMPRWNASISEVVRRDRNHPSIVIWGLVNEGGGAEYKAIDKHAALAMVRQLDPTRMVWMDSGGPYCNPEGTSWQKDLVDGHLYQALPLKGNGNSVRSHKPSTPTFLSEYSAPGPGDFAANLEEYRRLGHEHDKRAMWLRRNNDRFMVDWKRWGMDTIWKDPQEYLVQGWQDWSRLTQEEMTHFRSNPKIVGLSSTTMPGESSEWTGWSLTSRFRQARDPSVMAAMRLGHAPVRWCLFATPDNVYRGAKVRFEAVLADEDTLRPGVYAAQAELLGPDGRVAVSRSFEVRVAESTPGKERPLAFPVFDEEMTVDGPAGAYTFSIALTDRKDIPGGRLTFHVDDPAKMPAIPAEVVLWGKSPVLAEWLTAHNVKLRPWEAAATRRQIVLVGAQPPAPGGKEAFAELARRIARGDCVIFLDRTAFQDAREKRDVLWRLSMSGCRIAGNAHDQGNRWARRHPLLEGLPAGGMLDTLFYRDLLDGTKFTLGTYPSKFYPATRQPEVVIGCTYMGKGYGGITAHLAVFEMGAGRFVLNSFLIEANLGRRPAAERLLRNMLNYAARDLEKPLADLPADFGEALKAMGYE